MADATKRFATTADEMRRAAQDMQRELSQTREELQKGILDMPAEAREASAAMRHAITEQIEAINELSKIVARYAGESTPPPAPQPAVAAPPPPQAAGAPAEFHAAAAGARRRATAQGPAGGTARGRCAGRAARALRPSGKRRRQRSGEGGPAPGTAAGDARAVGQRRIARMGGRPAAPRLLQRRGGSAPPARAEPTPEVAGPGKRSPAQVVESLNSLSIDIARAIDHEASVELWDRYKRGERNVFTRRLYTLQGQQTFDELRRKYERDADFRQAVDNYIGDFERLLAQVSKDDADPTVARMYLTSDTGKVYTMLAHASRPPQLRRNF